MKAMKNQVKIAQNLHHLLIVVENIGRNQNRRKINTLKINIKHFIIKKKKIKIKK